MGDLCAPALARSFERDEELLDSGAVAPRAGPHQPASVVIDDHRQVLVVALVRDLVDADPSKACEDVGPFGCVGPNAGDDRSDGAPRDPHQLRDRGLRALGGQPGDLLVEHQRVASRVAGPGDLPHGGPVDRAIHPWRVGLEEHQRRAQVQRPPPTTSFAAVVPRSSLPASTAATVCRSFRPHVSDHQLFVLVELDVLDDGVLDAQ